MLNAKTMAEYAANGETPDVLFWVGCAGSFDQRAQKVTRSFVKILQHLNMEISQVWTTKKAAPVTRQKGRATSSFSRCWPCRILR